MAAAVIRNAPSSGRRSRRSRRSGRLGGIDERSAVNKHAVHDHCELAGKRHFGLLHPARSAIRIAQLFSAVHPLTGLVRMTWAPSKSTARTEASPIFEMRPLKSVSPDW